MTLDEINAKIAAAIGSEGYDLTLGDPSLAPDFNIDPAHLFWGQRNDRLVAILDSFPELKREEDRPTDVGDTISVWRAADAVIALEPEGA